jgi:hypothetical protein
MTRCDAVSGAKGAISLPACGIAPGRFNCLLKKALKARFMRLCTKRRGESRFQRWRFGLLRILARRARLELNAAPLALNTNFDESPRVKVRASSS